MYLDNEDKKSIDFGVCLRIQIARVYKDDVDKQSNIALIRHIDTLHGHSLDPVTIS
jgi:hypothetical protein